MRAIIQRVVSARVEVEHQIVGAIGVGLLVLAGFEEEDGDDDLAWLSSKLTRLRIFPDEAGVMNRSVVDVQGEILAVSQFTLFASVKKGNRPSWSRAARPELSQPLFERFVRQLETDLGRVVPTGVFGADMQVYLINDGPVTLSLDSKNPE
ncbi:MAG: D-aminoacyl-tRNA deacylase [Betaproteobacteria bacterium]